MKPVPIKRNLAATFATEFVDEFDRACMDCSYGKTDAIRAFANWWISACPAEKEEFCETNIIPRYQLKKIIEPLVASMVSEKMAKYIADGSKAGFQTEASEESKQKKNAR
jgi:hypothetical protein